MIPFKDRQAAGKELAERLQAEEVFTDGLVLGLPRGGVPVAYEVSQALRLPLDVLVVRKVGVPGHEELAMGAIGTGGASVINQQIVAGLGLTQEDVDLVVDREAVELLRRERTYRGARLPPIIQGRAVLLVDDGLATGASMRVAVQVLRQRRPSRIVVAVPVAPPETCAALAEVADEVVCARAPEPFVAVGRWYQDFEQVEDEDVLVLLERAWRKE